MELKYLITECLDYISEFKETTEYEIQIEVIELMVMLN